MQDSSICTMCQISGKMSVKEKEKDNESERRRGGEERENERKVRKW